MSPTIKLALRILGATAVLLALLGAALCGILLTRAPKAQNPEIFSQLGHADTVTSVAWSPDGTTLASASDDNTVKLWESRSGRLLRTLSGHAGSVTSVAWSPDGTTLASGSFDNTVKLWESGSGRLLRTLSSHEKTVTSVVWSLNGRTLASGSFDNTVKLWESGSGRLLRTLSGHATGVTSVAWSPDGTTLASGSFDRTVMLWESGSGRLLRTLSGHENNVYSVAWSPDGTRLASGSGDNTVKLWESGSGRLLRTLSGHAGPVYSVAWSPDGTTLASGSFDHTVKLWERGNGRLLRTLSGHANSVTSVAWSPDGTTLASGSGDRTVKLWQSGSGRLLRTLSGHENNVYSVAWSPDGTTLASGSFDNTVMLWESGSGRLLRTLSGHANSVTSVAWSPDGTRLASGSFDNTVKLWESGSGRLLRTLSGNAGPVASVAWSPDGTRLASGSFDNTVKLWESGSGRLLRTLSGNAGPVASVAWSPDWTTLAGGSWDKTVNLWDSGSGRLLRTLSGHVGTVYSVAWSPDGATLASGSLDKTVKLWKSGSGHLLRTLSGHVGTVYSVAWSPDGTTLASGSGDNTVKLWESGSGRLLRTLSGHDNPVRSVAWSPDGQTLASVGYDASLRLFSLNLGENTLTCFQLPANEWLSFQPNHLPYQSSLQGDQYLAVRFDNQLRPVYPLTYYRDELKTNNLQSALSRPPPQIKPKPILYAWDNFQNKSLWFSGFSLLYLSGLTVTLVLARRSDPTQISRQFFLKAGFGQADSTSNHTLLLRRRNASPDAVAIIFQPDQPLSAASTIPAKTYIIYRDKPPAPEQLHALKLACKKEVIPLSSAILERALSDETCAETLRELEEPFVARTDPYDESRPISDPTWFFGRDDMLERLPAVLRHGQHVGLFGLRKVGKTSLINQLRQRLITVPTVWIDCQGLPANASALFTEICAQLRKELHAQKKITVPDDPAPNLDFRSQIVNLHEMWRAAGGQDPFVLILDEVDKLFPDRRLKGGDDILSEWVKLSRVLRALAQEKKCLVTLVTAYRPDVNRQNLLSPEIGENPMFMSFQEYFLGSLSKSDTERMVSEIGAWKDIHWSPEALAETYELCGGHPLITRFFASDACDQGDLKQIDLAQVVATAGTIRRAFHKHRIGRYFEESIWNLLQEDERQALIKLVTGGSMDCLEEAVTHLEQFGLIRSENGTLRISATMLQNWLERSRPACATQ